MDPAKYVVSVFIMESSGVEFFSLKREFKGGPGGHAFFHYRVENMAVSGSE